MPSLVMTLIGTDRTGLVDSVAETVAAHGANWLESRMAHMAGQFAGILRVDVPDDRADALVAALEKLGDRGLCVVVERDAVAIDVPYRPWRLSLIGNDRPGIVKEVTHVLAERGVNVEEFQTECVSAPMSGEKLFQASALLRLPPGMSIADVEHQLEQIAADLMIDVTIDHSE